MAHAANGASAHIRPLAVQRSPQAAVDPVKRGAGRPGPGTNENGHFYPHSYKTYQRGRRGRDVYGRREPGVPPAS